jgi:hypothetical protein
VDRQRQEVGSLLGYHRLLIIRDLKNRKVPLCIGFYIIVEFHACFGKRLGELRFQLFLQIDSAFLVAFLGLFVLQFGQCQSMQ